MEYLLSSFCSRWCSPIFACNKIVKHLFSISCSCCESGLNQLNEIIPPNCSWSNKSIWVINSTKANERMNERWNEWANFNVLRSRNFRLVRSWDAWRNLYAAVAVSGSDIDAVVVWLWRAITENASGTRHTTRYMYVGRVGWCERKEKELKFVRSFALCQI